MKILRTSPAKINLFLYLADYNKKKDIFKLQTLFCKVPGLEDEIEIEESDKLEIISTPHIENNIVEKVLKELGISNVKITIKKNIPIGAGLGGGSSNAATVLMALSDDFEKNLAIARKLGYDIEFFIHGYKSMFFDEDERHAVDLGFNIPMLLVVPDFGIDTTEVFDLVKYTVKSDLSFPGFYRTAELTDIIQNVYCGKNDLYNYVYKVDSRINDVIDEIEISQDVLSFRISGSGSSCFGIFNSMVNAEAAGKRINELYPNWLCHHFLLKL